MPLLGWALVLFGPAACAAAGAVTAWLAARPRHEAELDAAYEAGYDEGRARQALYTGSMTLDLAPPARPPLEQARSAAIAAAETLLALPPAHHEGPRHARSQEPAQREYHDPLIFAVRAEFERIRMNLGRMAHR